MLLLLLLAQLLELKLSVSPETGFAPLAVQVRVTVPRDERNREIAILADCQGEPLQVSYESSEGDNASPVVFRKWTLPSCDAPLTITAVLRRIDGMITAKTKVVALGRE